MLRRIAWTTLLSLVFVIIVCLIIGMDFVWWGWLIGALYGNAMAEAMRWALRVRR